MRKTGFGRMFYPLLPMLAVFLLSFAVSLADSTTGSPALADLWVPVPIESTAAGSSNGLNGSILTGPLEWTHYAFWQEYSANPKLTPIPGHENQAATFVDPAGRTVTLIWLPYGTDLTGRDIVPEINPVYCSLITSAAQLPDYYQSYASWNGQFGKTYGLSLDNDWLYLEQPDGSLQPAPLEPMIGLSCLAGTLRYRIKVSGSITKAFAASDEPPAYAGQTLLVGDTRYSTVNVP